MKHMSCICASLLSKDMQDKPWVNQAENMSNKNQIIMKKLKVPYYEQNINRSKSPEYFNVCLFMFLQGSVI